MIVRNNFDPASLFLRLALGIPYLWFVSDRLGFLGAHGSPHVGWGDCKCSKFHVSSHSCLSMEY
jgi:putative oxidoreductase